MINYKNNQKHFFFESRFCYAAGANGPLSNRHLQLGDYKTDKIKKRFEGRIDGEKQIDGAIDKSDFDNITNNKKKLGEEKMNSTENAAFWTILETMALYLNDADQGTVKNMINDKFKNGGRASTKLTGSLDGLKKKDSIKDNLPIKQIISRSVSFYKSINETRPDLSGANNEEVYNKVNGYFKTFINVLNNFSNIGYGQEMSGALKNEVKNKENLQNSINKQIRELGLRDGDLKYKDSNGNTRNFFELIGPENDNDDNDLNNFKININGKDLWFPTGIVAINIVKDKDGNVIYLVTDGDMDISHHSKKGHGYVDGDRLTGKTIIGHDGKISKDAKTIKPDVYVRTKDIKNITNADETSEPNEEKIIQQNLEGWFDTPKDMKSNNAQDTTTTEQSVATDPSSLSEEKKQSATNSANKEYTIGDKTVRLNPTTVKNYCGVAIDDNTTITIDGNNVCIKINNISIVIGTYNGSDQSCTIPSASNIRVTIGEENCKMTKENLEIFISIAKVKNVKITIKGNDIKINFGEKTEYPHCKTTKTNPNWKMLPFFFKGDQSEAINLPYKGFGEFSEDSIKLLKSVGFAVEKSIVESDKQAKNFLKLIKEKNIIIESSIEDDSIVVSDTKTEINIGEKTIVKTGNNFSLKEGIEEKKAQVKIEIDGKEVKISEEISEFAKRFKSDFNANDILVTADKNSLVLKVNDKFGILIISRDNKASGFSKRKPSVVKVYSIKDGKATESGATYTSELETGFINKGDIPDYIDKGKAQKYFLNKLEANGNNFVIKVKIYDKEVELKSPNLEILIEKFKILLSQALLNNDGNSKSKITLILNNTLDDKFSNLIDNNKDKTKTGEIAIGKNKLNFENNLIKIKVGTTETTYKNNTDQYKVLMNILSLYGVPSEIKNGSDSTPILKFGGDDIKFSQSSSGALSLHINNKSFVISNNAMNNRKLLYEKIIGQKFDKTGIKEENIKNNANLSKQNILRAKWEKDIKNNNSYSAEISGAKYTATKNGDKLTLEIKSNK